MRDVVVGTAGHIDHGKTLLVKAMTGTDADRWEEEKRRGITLDIGFATLAHERATLHFVDLPGHERFIKNMLAGATGVDVSLLVVAADESVMPQTVEHAQILRLLGIRRGVVALNKMDLADAETGELALLELGEFLSGIGMGHWPILPVSALTGQGVPELIEALLREAEACGRPSGERPFRLPVDRVFPVKGFGTVVTGTCIDGRVAVGEDAEVYPSAGRSRVRGLQVFGAAVPSAFAGQRVAVNLPDLHHLDLRRGCLVASPGSMWPTHLLDVSVEVLPSARLPLKAGSTLSLHIHTQEVEAHLHLEGAGALGPGERGLAQLRLPEPVMAWPGDRFILRQPAPAGTVAGGEVLLVAQRKARWKRPVDRATAEALHRGDGLSALLVEAGPLGLSPHEVRARTGLTGPALESSASACEGTGALVRWGGGAWWLSGPEADSWVGRTGSWLKGKHGGKGPLEWVPRQEFMGRWQRILKPERAEALLEALVGRGAVEVQGDKVKSAGYGVRLTPKQREALTALRSALGGAGFPMATGNELEQACGPAVREILPILTGAGEVVRFGGDFFMAQETRARIREALSAWSPQHGGLISVPEFKELLGTTRKYVMPLLEHLDDLKWTRREGDGRRILVTREP